MKSHTAGVSECLLKPYFAKQGEEAGSDGCRKVAEDWKGF